MNRKRILILIVLIELGILAISLRPSAPQGDEPALIVQRIQLSLFEAQQSLATDPAMARTAVDAATAQHRSLAMRLPSSANSAAQAANGALADARAAVDANDAVALIQARADYQTALVWAGYLATLESTRAGRGADATVWLKLRAYKPSSRLNPASSEATLAAADLASGRLTSAQATTAVRRDLDATYQVLLVDAVGTSVTMSFQGSRMRAVEAAVTAAGYYRILRAGFAAQSGAQRAASVDQAFADLRAAVVQADWPAVQRAQAVIAQSLGG